MNMKPTFQSLLSLLTTLAAFSGHAIAADESRTIVTTGDAIVYVVPDEVVVVVGVETRNASLDEAKTINSRASMGLIKAIHALDVKDQHIGTDAVQVELRYQSQGIEIESYIVRRTYMVTLKDTRKLEPLIETVLKNGANQLGGVEFRSTELRKHRDAARSMAIKAAKEKAVALARDLDCAVGAPRTIGESSGIFWGGWQGLNRYGIAQNAMQSVGGAGQEGETLPLGQIAIRATVSVSFDLIVAANKASE